MMQDQPAAWPAELDPTGWEFAPFAPNQDAMVARHSALPGYGIILSGQELLSGVSERRPATDRAAADEYRRRKAAPLTHEASPEPAAAYDRMRLDEVAAWASRCAALEAELAGARAEIARLRAPAPPPAGDYPAALKAQLEANAWWANYGRDDPRLGARPYLEPRE